MKLVGTIFLSIALFATLAISRPTRTRCEESKVIDTSSAKEAIRERHCARYQRPPPSNTKQGAPSRQHYPMKLDSSSQCDFLRLFLHDSAAIGDEENCCDWPGVLCGGPFGEVTELHLMKSAVFGTIPDVLCRELPKLQYLDLSWNLVEGAWPTSLPNCSKLVHLDVRNCFFSTLPAALPPSLVYFNAGENAIEGTLPVAWASTTSIEALHLASNHLHGSFPPSWSKWTSLMLLDVSNNSLTGTLPAEFASWAAIEFADFHMNNLTGTLLADWGVWESIELLDLSNNRLSGTLPPQWASMSALKYVDLGINLLHGTLPDDWHKLTQLENFYVYAVNVTGALPESWGWSMQSLVNVWVAHTNLNQPLPSSWFNMVNLTSFYAFETPINGTLPESWSLLPKLDTVNIDSARLSGTLPRSWANISRLTYLSLRRNQLTGTLPREWFALPLEALFLDSNKLHGTLPREWKTTGTKILLSSNELEGTLPSSWCQPYIYLHSNYLTGVETPICDSVQSLHLNNNRIAGSLPCPANVQILDLGGNYFSGAMPDCYDDSSLTSLFVDFNTITEWPASLNRTEGLSQLSLSHNLVNTIPPANFFPTSLSELYLNYNRIPRLDQPLDAMTNVLTNLCVLDLSNNNLTLDTAAVSLNPVVSALSIVEFSGNNLVGLRPTRVPRAAVDNRSTRCSPGLEWGSLFHVTSTSAEFGGLTFVEATSFNIISRWEARLRRTDHTLSTADSYAYGSLRNVPCSVICVPDTLVAHNILYASASTAIDSFGFEMFASTNWFSYDANTRCQCPILQRERLLTNFVALSAFSLQPSLGLPWENKVELLRPSASGIFTREPLSADLPYDVPFRVRIDITFFGETLPPHYSTLKPISTASDAFMRTLCPSLLQAAVPNTTICFACPDQCVCNGSSIITTTEELWRPSVTYTNLIRCEMQGCRSSVPRQGWECATGYIGPLCGACSNGYKPLDDRCIPCLKSEAGGSFVVVGFLFLLIIFVAAVVLLEIRVAPPDTIRSGSTEDDMSGSSILREKLLNLSFFKKAAELKQNAEIVKKEVLIMVKMLGNHLGIMSYVLQSRAASIMLSSAAWVSQSASAPAQATRADQLRVYIMCVLNFSPVQMMYAIGPVLAMLFAAVFFIVFVLSRFPKTGVPRPKKKWRSIMAIIFLLFADTMLNTATAPLSCDTLIFNNALGGTTQFDTMRVDRTIKCTGTSHRIALVIGWIQIFMAIIGMPFFCIVMFVQLRRKKGNEHAIATFAFMCGNFKPQQWFWELILLARKNICVIVLVAVQDVVTQLIVLNFVLVVFLVAHQRIKPYSHGAYNRNDTISIVNAIVAIDVIAVFLRYTVITHTIGVVVVAVISVVGIFPFPVTMIRRIRQNFDEQRMGRGSAKSLELRSIVSVVDTTSSRSGNTPNGSGSVGRCGDLASKLLNGGPTDATSHDSLTTSGEAQPCDNDSVAQATKES